MVNYRENTVGVYFEELEGSRAVYSAVKRGIDMLLSFIALVLLAVPMLVVALVVALDSKGSPIFRQKRVGRDGRLFYIYKFRTMVVTAPSETATCDLLQPQMYITRIGNILRKTSLDELPQLVNVLKGDMSLIGPRPIIAGETLVHRLRTDAGVYAVRPGITGWAQVNGRDDIATEDKVRLDAEYVSNYSLWFDFRVILRTVAVVLTGDGYREGAQSPTEPQTENRDSELCVSGKGNIA